MKKIIYRIFSAALAVTALVSCAKEQFRENFLAAGEMFEVSIRGRINEFKSVDATKASSGSVVRVSWSSGDKVYVYDGTDASIGTLTVTPDGDNGAFALLSGTITASAASPAPTKLTLVYVKGADTAPAISSGKISIDLSTQNQEEVPFVLYATIDYRADKLTKENAYVPFTFATSVMMVNCTGLAIGDGGSIINITKAEIDGVNTACELTVSSSGVTVAGATNGKITRSAGFSQTDSRCSFKLAVAAEPNAMASRNILVYQGDKVNGAQFTSSTLVANYSYNTVYQLREYVSNGSGGYAPVTSITGLTLGKISTSIEAGASDSLTVTIAPDNATYKNVVWKSSEDAVATVDENGKVTAVSEGVAKITATATDGTFTAVCIVTVTAPAIPEYVIIGGKKWATKNLGATSITDSGDYYMWGATELAYESLDKKGNQFTFKTSKPESYENSTWDASNGFGANNCPYTDGVRIYPNNNIFTKYTADNSFAKSGTKDDKTTLESCDDVVYKTKGDGWRMPTKEDFDALYTACGGTGDQVKPTVLSSATPSKGIYWLNEGQTYIPIYKDVCGVLFVDENGQKLFFPSTGIGDGLIIGSGACYWSSTLNDTFSSNAYCLDVTTTKVRTWDYNRYMGFPVRPVSDNIEK